MTQITQNHILRSLTLADFLEAHADDLCIENGKMMIREYAQETLNNTIRSLFSQERILTAGATKRSVLVPGYRYRLKSGKGNHISLLSVDEKGIDVHVTLLDFLNAFCHEQMPKFDDR